MKRSVFAEFVFCFLFCVETWGLKLNLFYFMGKVVFLVWGGCVYACFGVLLEMRSFLYCLLCYLY